MKKQNRDGVTTSFDLPVEMLAQVRETSIRVGMKPSAFYLGARESVILLEIVGAEENPKTGRRWHDRVKESVKYIGRTLVPLAFVLDIFFGM